MSTSFSCSHLITFSTPSRFKRDLNEGWDRMNSRLLSDSELAVEMVSDRDRPVELIPFVDTGQNQHNLQLTCPSPPSHGTGSMPPMKCSPSPLEGSGSEQHTKKKRPQSGRENPADDEAVSAEGSDSVDSTLTTTDHPASVIMQELPELQNFTEEDTQQEDCTKLIYRTSKKVYRYLHLTKMKPKNIKQIVNHILKNICDKNINPLQHNILSSDNNIKDKFHDQLHQVREEVKKGRQYAVAFLMNSDETVVKKFGPFYPTTKNDPHSGLHSEDFLVSKLLKMLKSEKNKSIFQHNKLFIYSRNSPCLGKISGIPCIILIYYLAFELARMYGIRTYVAFSKYYGFAGSNVKYLNNINGEHYETVIQANHESKFRMGRTSSFNLIKIVRKIIPKYKGNSALLDSIIQSYKPECCNGDGNNDSMHTAEEWKNKFKDSFSAEIEKFKNLLRLEDEDFIKRICDCFQSYWKTWKKNVEEAQRVFLNKKLSPDINIKLFEIYLKNLQELFSENTDSLPDNFIQFIHLPEIHVNKVTQPADNLE